MEYNWMEKLSIPIKKSEFKNSIRSQFVSALEGTKGEVEKEGEGKPSRRSLVDGSSTRATKPARPH